MSDMLRITGMATGIDTESMINKLIQTERIRVDKVEQDKTYTQWKIEEYRKMSNLLRGFNDNYFNYAKPSTNFRSSSIFNAFGITTQISGIDTTAVIAKSTGATSVGTHTLNKISMAKKALWKSSGAVASSMTGGAIDFTNLKEGKSFDITLDGTKKTITLNSSAAAAGDATTLSAELQTLVDNAFGSGNITVTDDGLNHLEFQAQGHSVSISSTTQTYASALGFSNGQTNSITGSELDFSSPISISGDINIDVNGVKTNVAIDITNAADITDFTTQLQTNIDSALGAGVVNVSNNGDKVKLISYNTSDEITVLSGDTTDVIGQVGFNSGLKISKLQGTVNLSTSDIGKEFDIYVGATQYHIDLPADYTTMTDLTTEINSQLSSQGASITVGDDGSGKLTFNGTNGSEIKIANSTESIVDELGFTTGDSNVLKLGTSLKDLSLATPLTFNGGKAEFEINGVNFTFDETDTLQEVIDDVNASSAGVTLGYSSLSDRFTLQADNEGAVNDITINDLNGTNLLSGALKLSQEQVGTDAQFTLDGVTTTRSSNNFTIDGIEYLLSKDYDPDGTQALDDIEITVNANTDEAVSKIKEFVEKYNELITTINNSTSEKRDYEYRPLTQAQKEAMSEDEIEMWEEKAKSGILRSDSTLRNITSSMRRALYDSVEGVGISLYDIGIKTSPYYEDKGKLVIDEEKLKSALKENPSDVVNLFTKQSDVSYIDTANRSQRYNEEGLANRLHDIIQDNIRTSRGEDGRKGILLEKAGIENDLSEFQNTLYSEIEGYDDRINQLLDDLANKEEYYYLMFGRMETAIQQMNSQASWLQSQLGGGMQ